MQRLASSVSLVPMKWTININTTEEQKATTFHRSAPESYTWAHFLNLSRYLLKTDIQNTYQLRIIGPCTHGSLNRYSLLHWSFKGHGFHYFTSVGHWHMNPNES